MGCFLVQSLLNLVVTEEVLDDILASSNVWSKFELLKIYEAFGLNELQVLGSV